MELGQRLRQARLEAGLSQRQLCGDTITRNMLSQIENGTARPSMETLRFLARELGKPVSFFLEEEAVTSPNPAVMAQARQAFAAGDFARVTGELEDYRGPDPLFDAERDLLLSLALLHQAGEAASAGKNRYALELLNRLEEPAARCLYWDAALERCCRILVARLSPERAGELPPDDEALMARAASALEQKNPARAGQYLDAAEQQSALWHLLRGEVCFAQGDYTRAAVHFHAAEADFSQKAFPRLEICYREMGDFRRAYEYACRQK